MNDMKKNIADFLDSQDERRWPEPDQSDELIGKVCLLLLILILAYLAIWGNA